MMKSDVSNVSKQNRVSLPFIHSHRDAEYAIQIWIDFCGLIFTDTSPYRDSILVSLSTFDYFIQTLTHFMTFRVKL